MDLYNTTRPKYLHAKELKLFSIKVQTQTPSQQNTLFSLQRSADFNLPDLFQTLEPITSLPEERRGEIETRGNVGCLHSLVGLSGILRGTKQISSEKDF